MKKKSTPGLLTCEKHNASQKFSGILKFLFAVPFIFLLLISLKSFAQADLMVRDCLNDELSPGVEPSSSCNPIPIYASDGIKIAQNPFSGYTPVPFTAVLSGLPS